MSFPRCTSLHPSGKTPKDRALVLAYATKHRDGYMDIANIAAPLTLSLPHADVASVLPPVAVLPYVRFRCIFSGSDLYSACMYILEVLMHLGVARLESLLNLSAIFNDTSLSANCLLSQ
jgi:hypothetical protein